jgi:hypothetical protein
MSINQLLGEVRTSVDVSSYAAVKPHAMPHRVDTLGFASKDAFHPGGVTVVAGGSGGGVTSPIVPSRSPVMP